jgi:hypothetical protein
MTSPPCTHAPRQTTPRAERGIAGVARDGDSGTRLAAGLGRHQEATHELCIGLAPRLLNAR